jgi:hypothetical protein
MRLLTPEEVNQGMQESEESLDALKIQKYTIFRLFVIITL